MALQQELEVQLLLEKGADITTRIDSGETALHIAAKNGSKRIMQLFLEKGADTTVKDDGGFTALY